MAFWAAFARTRIEPVEESVDDFGSSATGIAR